MTAKQATGTFAPDGSKYGSATNGSGTLAVISTVSKVTSKQAKGSQAPDGSIYFTLTNGSGTLA